MNEHTIADMLADSPADVAPVASASANVVDQDRWSRRRGQRIADHWVDSGIVDDPPDVPTVQDAHASLFEPSPSLADSPANAQRAAWWRQMTETPEYRALHNQTCLDAMAAELASKSIVDEWSAYAAEHQQADGDPAPGSDDEPIGDEVARIRSTRQAIDSAQEAADQAASLAAGFDPGTGGTIDPAELRSAFARARNSRLLQQIMAMAGRYRARCRSLQRQTVSARRGEISGIELAGDIGRLVPWELLQVAGAVPELETMALYRLACRRSLCWRMMRREPVAAGPIVIGVDESGSMSEGAPMRIAQAKGLALAMVWLAQQQQRWVCGYGFGTSAEGHYVVCPPGKRDSATLMAWLEHWYRGGTEIGVSADRLPREWWPELVAQGLVRGRTDHIILTDGQLHVPDDVRDSYRAWAQAENVRSYSLVLGQTRAGAIESISDQCWSIPDLNVSCSAVEQVLSI